MPAYATNALPKPKSGREPMTIREVVPADDSPPPLPRLLSVQACVQLGAALAMAAPLLYVLGRFTDVDLILADLLFDRASNTFPWREAWLTTTFGHGILKAVLLVLAAIVLMVTVAGAILPQSALAKPLNRVRLRVIAWCAVLVPMAISLLKQGSNAHCPWDLVRYGGTQPYVRVFEALPPGVLPGHCLPAGHASSALWLVSLGVCSLPGPTRRTYLAWGLALAPGLVLGWMQQMRGAHFLTHTLWSVWIACAIVLALITLLQARDTRYSRGGGAGHSVSDGSCSRTP